MKVLNFGSLNVDYVYDVPHFVQPGETITATARNIFAGGKGLNQSVAMAKAGVPVQHAGCIGTDGDILLTALDESGIDAHFIHRQAAPGGHTVIQVNPSGQNCIIVYAGTNRMLSREYIDQVLGNFGTGDLLVLQNEINELAYIMDKAYASGMQIVFNPSPCDDIIPQLPLEKVKYFIINEIEGALIAQTEEIEDIIPAIRQKYPQANILLTLGTEGAKYLDGSSLYHQDVFPVKAVDTTAAGDTFLGYFVYGILNELPPEKTLRIAAKASSITVSYKGAAGSIPTLEQVVAQLDE